jgi:pimeloyl-ACP methyl ester carboxylesterase
VTTELNPSAERIVTANGVDLCLETFGDRDHPAILLIAGGASSMLDWGVHHPDPVASLTLISTSPAGAAADDPDLPSASEEFMAGFGAAPPPDWSERDAVIDYVVAQYRLCTSKSRPVPEAYLRELARRTVERAGSIASMNNHFLLDPGHSSDRAELAGISVPTLVVHGTEDPLFPIAHGAALARDIPGAQLLKLHDTGHELPPAAWDTVIPAILGHTTDAGQTGRHV